MVHRATARWLLLFPSIGKPGVWGKNLVRNFAELGHLASVTDTERKRAAKVAALYNVPSITFEELLAESSAKAVVLATPAVTHAALTRQLLEADKDVMVEEPLALRERDACRLIELAEQRAVSS